MERCNLLAEARRLVEREEMRTWKARHVHKTVKKKKGPVGPKKEEEEEDKLERFFFNLHEFHNPVESAPVFVPAVLPPRYAINFVPAVVSNPAEPVVASPVSSPDYSVVSSANFVIPSSPVSVSPASVSSASVSSATCIETK